MPAEAGAGLVLFRVDGGRIAGVSLGHVFRCLALAGELAEAGLRSAFLMRADPRGPAVVRERGFEVIEIPAGADLDAERRLVREARPDLVVVDLLRLGDERLAALRLDGRPLVVLDDLGGLPLAPDLLVNGSAVVASHRYRPGPGRALLGPRYAVLGREFRGRERPPTRRHPVRLLLTLGGSDPAGRAEVVLRELPQDVHFQDLVFIAGPAFAAGPGGEERLRRMKTRFRVQENVPDLSMSLLSADLVLTAGGRTAYELAALGIPALVLPTAAHEVETARALAEAGTCRAISGAEPERLGAELAELLEGASSYASRRAMAEAGPRLVDGRGGERVARELIALLGG